jgi:hypothetical protein
MSFVIRQQAAIKNSILQVKIRFYHSEPESLADRNGKRQTRRNHEREL